MKKNTKEILNLQRFLLPQFIRLLGAKSPRPFIVNFYLTFKCNLRCKMCYQSESINAGFNSKELNLEELKKIIDGICRSSILRPIIKVTGGEPLLHKDFLAFLQYLKEKKLKVTLNTNGELLDKFSADLVRLGVDYISISLDGPKSIHNSIRTGGNYEKVVANIKNLISVRNLAQKKLKPRVSVNTVITGQNYLHLIDTLKIVSGLGVDAMTFQHLIFSERESDRASLIEPDKLIKQMIEIRKANSGLPVSFFPVVKLNQVERYYNDINRDFPGKCYMPWVLISVQPDGRLNPCFLQKFSLGNVRDLEFDLAKAWNIPSLRSLRRGIRKRLPDECRRCCLRLY